MDRGETASGSEPTESAPKAQTQATEEAATLAAPSEAQDSWAYQAEG